MEFFISLTVADPSLSVRDGVSSDVEVQYRRKTAWFIEEFGKEMKWSVTHLQVITSINLIRAHIY